LFDEFTAYVKHCRDKRKEEKVGTAIFPCALEIVKDAVFNRGSPIIIGVNVKAGFLKVGTPLCVPERDVSFYLIFLIVYIEHPYWYS
jgi:translation initiation factor 5B